MPDPRVDHTGSFGSENLLASLIAAIRKDSQFFRHASDVYRRLRQGLDFRDLDGCNSAVALRLHQSAMRLTRTGVPGTQNADGYKTLLEGGVLAQPAGLANEAN
ncbi:MAG: hypothetical protein KatS3mg112_0920 [Thermogutta sp.]|nr:MAG: hypothetical protein KatS3mg112_0920 [Thermogutta sp.]